MRTIYRDINISANNPGGCVLCCIVIDLLYSEDKITLKEIAWINEHKNYCYYQSKSVTLDQPFIIISNDKSFANEESLINWIDNNSLGKQPLVNSGRVMKSYYSDQLNKITTKTHYPTAFRIDHSKGSTNWITLTDQSATDLVNWLKENFNISEDANIHRNI